MVLALRIKKIEPLLGGLDKSYRLHKWLGVTGLVFAVLHFLLANVSKILIGQGLLEEPAEEPATTHITGILKFLQDQHLVAEEFGDWGFKFAFVLIALALIRKIPYRPFLISHRLMSLLFLFLVFHSLALMKFSYWESAVAPVMVLLMGAGTIAAAISLVGKVGSGRRALGEIEDMQYIEKNSVLKVAIKLKSRWEGHEEGQFAFVTFDRKEGAHPFTIATPWKNDGRVSFFIKDLGDYTRSLPASLKPGDLATVEGPYGCFGFSNEKPRQIWIAGGIGIAPFAARIKALMEDPNDKIVDFFYSASRSDGQAFIDRIIDASKKANIQLHLVLPASEGRLDAKQICEAVPDWKEADFWFCGPTSFGESLSDQLLAKGLSRQAFHQELFEMR